MKKYGDMATAEEMIELIREGKITNDNTAYRELLTIIMEWPDTSVSIEAQYLLDTKYHFYSGGKQYL